MRALAGETVEQAEMFMRAPGEPEGRWHSVNASPVRDADGTIRGAVTISRDITELRRAVDKLTNAAVRDDLTGLLNRRGFHEQAALVVHIANRTSRPLALIYIDLNGMKAINDDLGHAAGDRALIETAKLLRKTFRVSDLVARLGGDEFVVLAPEYGEDNDGIAVRVRFRNNLTSLNANGSHPFRLSASVGIAIYDPRQRHRTIEELLAEADQRMYTVKERRRLDGTLPLEKIR